jgi:hypothetical protein
MLRSSDFAASARYYLKEGLERLCIENVQTSILIAEYAGAQSDRSTEASYFCIAAKTAQLLNFDTISHVESRIEREVYRRVWSSCYMIDVWSSAGLGISRNLDRSYSTQSCMMEDEFQDLDPTSKQTKDATTTSPGLWAHMIKLAHIFVSVQEYHQRLLVSEGDYSGIYQTAAIISAKFDAYLNELPADIHLNDGNLDSHIRRGLGQTLVALHLGFHHYATLLYYPYLDRADSASEQESSFSSRCKFHAAALSDIIKMSLQRPNCQARYHIVGHMTTISSSVLLYTLLFGDETELGAARDRLQINFAKLIELNKYWLGTSEFVREINTPAIPYDLKFC